MLTVHLFRGKGKGGVNLAQKMAVIAVNLSDCLFGDNYRSAPSECYG